MNYQETKNFVTKLFAEHKRLIILVGSGENGKSFLCNELREEGYDIVPQDTFSRFEMIGTRIIKSNDMYTFDWFLQKGYIVMLNSLDELDGCNISEENYDIVDMNHLHFGPPLY